MVVFRLSFSQPEPPAIVMDYDPDVIRVFEGGRATVEGFIIKLPLWRSDLPDEPGKILSVFVVAGAAPVCREVILIPPLQLGFWRQRHSAGLLAADQIPTHRDHGFTSLRPERRNDVRCSGAPIKTGDRCALNLEGIHEFEDIQRQRCGLAVAAGSFGKKPRRTVSA